jgi:AhpD family alkylhydroperoxidase
MTSRLKAFREYRERMNDKILASATLTTKRFFNLDTRCYEDGALDARTKEIAGLSASLVLRCDDCIAYHVIRCVELGVTREEVLEVFDVGLIVGGSIVIPHLRRAHELLDEVLAENSS